MKRLIFHGLLILFIFVFVSCPTQAADKLAWYENLPINSMDYYGKLSLDTSYAWGDGSLYNFTVQNGIPAGFHLNYILELDLEGDLNTNYLKSYLYYPSLGEREFSLTFESPNWFIDYDTMEIQFHHLNTTFAKQEIKGIRVYRPDQKVEIFYGTKTYQTKTFRTSVKDENELKYSLFDGTDGDLVENSEIVFLEGERLQRYNDYKMNYLDGTMTLLTPLRTGSELEVKYNFIPQGEKVNDRVGGAYYQMNVDRSSASVFYFHQMKENTTMAPDPNDPFMEIEVIEQDYVNYMGSAFNVIQDQFSLTGEMAWSHPCAEKLKYGGQIDLYYTPLSGLDLQYQLTTATSDYEGVGSVPIAAGEKHQINGAYQVNEAWNFDLELARIRKEKRIEKQKEIIILEKDDSEEIIESLQKIGDASIHYQFHPKHQLSLSLHSSSLEENNTSITSVDYLSGWKYQIAEELVFSLENSLQELKKHELNLEMNTYKLRFNSEYKQYDEIIPNIGEVWWRECNTDLTYRPFNGITVIGDLDYQQNMEYTFADSKRRLALTVLAAPNPKISTRSNYVYFYNPDTQCQTLFYDTNTTFILPYNLQWNFIVDHIQIDSDTVSNINAKWNTSFQLPLFDRVTLSYQIGKREEEEYLKHLDRVNRGDDALTQGYGVSYLFNDLLTISLTYTNSVSENITGFYSVTEKDNQIELNLNYFKDNNILEYTFGYLRNSAQDPFSNTLQKDQLQQKITWDHTWKQISYNYKGEIIYSLLDNEITYHQETVTAQWKDELSPFKPSIELTYIDINNEEQDWTKQKIAGKLSYELAEGKNIFMEVGNAGIFNDKETDKTYLINFIRTGVEYNF